MSLVRYGEEDFNAANGASVTSLRVLLAGNPIMASEAEIVYLG